MNQPMLSNSVVLCSRDVVKSKLIGIEEKNIYKFKAVFSELGCETGEYGDDCKPCSECKTCDVNNGICGKFEWDCEPTIYWFKTDLVFITSTQNLLKY